MNNVYSFDVFDGWKRFQIIILNFACIAATSQRFDWLKLKFEYWIQVDRKNFCFERIEFNWICDWNLIDQFAKRKENIFICMKFKFFLNNLFALSSKYDFLIVSRRSRRIYFLKILKWCSWMYKKKVIDITRKTFSRRIFESKIKFDILKYEWFWTWWFNIDWFNLIIYYRNRMLSNYWIWLFKKQKLLRLCKKQRKQFRLRK